MTNTTGDVTQLLSRYSSGENQMIEAIMPLVYDEMRKVAAAQLRKMPSSQTLQATALVHEVFIKMLNQNRLSMTNRSQFMGVAAILMRRIVVDGARMRMAEKRGGCQTVLPYDESLMQGMSVSRNDEEILAIDAALKELTAEDKRVAEVLSLRYFGGLELDEISEALEISLATVKRDITFGKAFLVERLGPC